MIKVLDYYYNFSFFDFFGLSANHLINSYVNSGIGYINYVNY